MSPNGLQVWLVSQRLEGSRKPAYSLLGNCSNTVIGLHVGFYRALKLGPNARNRLCIKIKLYTKYSHLYILIRRCNLCKYTEVQWQEWSAEVKSMTGRGNTQTALQRERNCKERPDVWSARGETPGLKIVWRRRARRWQPSVALCRVTAEMRGKVVDKGEQAMKWLQTVRMRAVFCLIRTSDWVFTSRIWILNPMALWIP
jgi:hypothetical protein